MVKEIFGFHIIADMRFKNPRWRVHWIGQWDYHIMDWRGCNYRLIKAKGQPKNGFTSYWEANEWAKVEEKNLEYRSVEGEGVHQGDRSDYDPRDVKDDDYRVSDGKEFTQEQWDKLKEKYKIWREE